MSQKYSITRIVDSISPESLAYLTKDKNIDKRFYTLFEKSMSTYTEKTKLSISELSTTFGTNVLPLFDKSDLQTICKPPLRNFERKLAAAYGLNKIRKQMLDQLANQIEYEHEGKPLSSYFPSTIETNEDRSQILNSILSAGDKMLKNMIIQDCLIGQISQMTSLFFFGFEAIAKTFNISFCYKFATRVNQGLTIQHNDIWKTLKMLGGDKSSTDCLICKLRDVCNYNYPFTDLANLYAFIIKIRMLADYTEVLFMDRSLFEFLNERYAQLMFDFNLDIEQQIKTIHKDFLWFPTSLKDDFNRLDVLLPAV